MIVGEIHQHFGTSDTVLNEWTGRFADLAADFAVRAFYFNERHRGLINNSVFWFHAIIIDEIQAEDKHKKAPGRRLE
jgi:hypothetical protein